VRTRGEYQGTGHCGLLAFPWRMVSRAALANRPGRLSGRYLLASRRLLRRTWPRRPTQCPSRPRDPAALSLIRTLTEFHALYMCYGGRAVPCQCVAVRGRPWKCMRQERRRETCALQGKMQVIQRLPRDSDANPDARSQSPLPHAWFQWLSLVMCWLCASRVRLGHSPRAIVVKNSSLATSRHDTGA
jgi:hypothetical protein